MEFKKCLIGGVQYGDGTTLAGVINRARKNKENMEEELIKYQIEVEKWRALKPPGYLHPHVEFDGEDKLKEALTGNHYLPTSTLIVSRVCYLSLCICACVCLGLGLRFIDTYITAKVRQSKSIPTTPGDPASPRSPPIDVDKQKDMCHHFLVNLGDLFIHHFLFCLQLCQYPIP